MPLIRGVACPDTMRPNLSVADCRRRAAKRVEAIVDVLLKIDAGAFSFEAANPWHEHEYHVFAQVSPSSATRRTWWSTRS